MYGPVFISSLLAFASAAATAPRGNSGTRLAYGSNDSIRFQNMVYYTDWSIYARDFPVSSLPAANLTHILYAFLNVKDDGTVFSGDTWSDIEKTWPGDESDATATNSSNLYGCAKQLYLLKKEHRHLKTLLSIGGWSWSTNFPSAASTDENRKTFAQSSVKLMADWGFDGVDIDWEYPQTTEDAANFLLLLQAVRNELDAYAAANTPYYHYQLTIAASAGPLKYNYLNMTALGDILDYVNLMAYDYGGSWDTTSGYLANVYPSDTNSVATPFNTEQAINAYLEGIPAHKMILGMPIYGRGFLNTNGIGLPYNGIGTGTWEAGVWDYKALPKNGSQVYYDSSVIGAYSYDNATQELISYDTPQVVTDKVKYIQSLNLGGTMFWEASADKTGEESLIYTSYKSQGGAQKMDTTQNQLSYPVSIYDNLKAGMP